MILNIINEEFSVCKVADYEGIDLSSPYIFIGSTDEEKSLIGIFAISTFNTDYILTKSENFERAIGLLQSKGYSIK